MGTQNRRRNHGADRAFKTTLYGLRFARARNTRQYLPGFENLASRHRDRLLRYLRNVGKPGFAYLLLAAGFIQRHDDVGVLSFKVGRGVVECDVPVLANSQKCNIHGAGCELYAYTAHYFRRISSVAVEQVIVGNSSFVHQLVQQHLPKTSWVGGRQADVFIEMKNFYTRPVDTGRLGQGV